MHGRAPPAVLSLLGVSGSGKTAFAVELVRRWSTTGRRVGYVKHASHGFDMDRPGKDTARVTEAGAAGVAVTGPGGTAYLERAEAATPADLVTRFFADRDVVVLEGFRAHGFPAVVIVGGAPPPAALAEARGPVLAVVAGETGVAAARAAAGTTPVFARDDVDGLVGHLERALGLPARS